MTKLLQENKLKNAKLEKLEAKIVTKDKTKIIERQRLEIKLCKLLSKTTFAYTEEYLGCILYYIILKNYLNSVYSLILVQMLQVKQKQSVSI